MTMHTMTVPGCPNLFIDKERDILAKVFRLFKTKNGACIYNLYARFTYTNDGWTVTFYTGGHDAYQNYKPLTSFTPQTAELARVAMDLLATLDYGTATSLDSTKLQELLDKINS